MVRNAVVTQVTSQTPNPDPTQPPRECVIIDARPAPAAYPNPADTTLYLAAPATTEARALPRTAVLYNAQGREVRRASGPAPAELRAAGLPVGLYYLRVEQNGRVSRHQIRVQH
ncbi:T9SS type A sorting domain-containing protein [Hymenobacter armeniacus]|uniref:T9SS type A sorting domain-containing protein n=1 Tax=Hymenobacter armeniacus TaxID=2771358 RepID=A0ABR8JX71_9BACT|nr:T9SS type A sorting domain-containing protein [Hymenobacter armeniacus]MBD2723406.1 T9SS type A sorting domain-containing protein [Hymenobacter armeniacus]